MQFSARQNVRHSSKVLFAIRGGKDGFGVGWRVGEEADRKVVFNVPVRDIVARRRAHVVGGWNSVGISSSEALSELRRKMISKDLGILPSWSLWTRDCCIHRVVGKGKRRMGGGNVG